MMRHLAISFALESLEDTLSQNKDSDRLVRGSDERIDELFGRAQSFAILNAISRIEVREDRARRAT